MVDAILTWLVRWLFMVPWNMGVVLCWFGLRAFGKGPERAALRATWDANWRTRRPVIFRRKHPLDHPDWPAYIRTFHFGYIIYVNTALPGSPHSTVHEVLHLLLTEEQYPWPVLPEDALTPDPGERLSWLCGFSNALHHPEIYRRMEHVYHLPMGDYWQRHRQQAIDMIQAWSESDLPPGDLLTAILFVFSWYFVPNEVSGPVQIVFSAAFPDEHAVCLQIRASAAEQNLSIHDREGMGQICLIVRERCLAYSAQEGLPPRYDNALGSMTFQAFHSIPVTEFHE